MNIPVKIHFFGAAGTVTGSKFLLETPEKNILIDCGMFQGVKDLRLLNWEAFPFPPDSIDCVLLTHGHLDHCGYLPKLVQQGFQGAVTGTEPTLAIASIILRDSAKIHEEDADRANDEGFSKHNPALPFYTEKDAEKAIALFQSKQINQWITLSDNINYRFRKNGHIIGAVFIEMELFGKRVVFSGDIGRPNDLLLDPPEKPEWADFIIMESTYGDTIHPPDDSDAILIESIKQCIHDGSTLIIPSFAVERLQTLMYKLWTLYNQNKIPNIPIFIDTPMGNEVLGIFSSYNDWHKLSPQEFKSMTKHFHITTSYKDTWAVIDDKRAKIVIAGSGMVTGGRVLTYLRYYLDNPKTQVLLVGYQAEGTRGRLLINGASEIKLHGKDIPVKAQIKTTRSLSAHADQKELTDWLSEIKNIPETIFLIHGETDALEAFKSNIQEVYKWKVIIPELNSSFKLGV